MRKMCHFSASSITGPDRFLIPRYFLQQILCYLHMPLSNSVLSVVSKINHKKLFIHPHFCKLCFSFLASSVSSVAIWYSLTSVLFTKSMLAPTLQGVLLKQPNSVFCLRCLQNEEFQSLILAGSSKCWGWNFQCSLQISHYWWRSEIWNKHSKFLC